MAEEAVLGLLVCMVNELGDGSSSDEEDPALRQSLDINSTQNMLTSHSSCPANQTNAL